MIAGLLAALGALLTTAGSTYLIVARKRATA